ncbi:modification methylase DpnIIA [archaeon BMS3Bbin16]|nr:modification methylase DpnIIA [archaeon BMS3Bbin16]
MKPFLKWAGGKRWFVGKYSNFLPLEYNRYIEPFMGSGAIFFWLRPKKALISDCNKDLIESYLTLKYQPDAVWKKLIVHQRNHSKVYYYKIRSSSPRNAVTRAARFIYLNRTCFNGLYRVNQHGKFNVPKGTKNTVIFPNDDFSAVSKLLENCTLLTQDFEKTIRLAGKGDLLYIDPPYTVQHNNNNFVKYNEQLFRWADQERLENSLKQAASRGAFILISNADSKCIHDLYSDQLWSKICVTRYSVLAANALNRKPTSELVISNYLNEKGAQVNPRGGN